MVLHVVSMQPRDYRPLIRLPAGLDMQCVAPLELKRYVFCQGDGTEQPALKPDDVSHALDEYRRSLTIGGRTLHFPRGGFGRAR